MRGIELEVCRQRWEVEAIFLRRESHARQIEVVLALAVDCCCRVAWIELEYA
eukprot:COSAG02_NODE_6609_length_3462_cov_2.162355_3_plen_52_part_00